MRRFLGLLLAGLAGAAGAGEPAVELVGFGAADPPLAYATGRFVPLRFRVNGGAPGAGHTVLLRRDDGATTLVTDAEGGGRVATADVPLKAGGFTLNEYRAFLLGPDGGVTEAPAARSVIRLGAAGAATLMGERRRRLSRAGHVAAEPPRLAAAGRPATPGEGFEARLAAGVDVYEGR